MIRVVGTSNVLAMFGRALVAGELIEEQGVEATAQAIAADAKSRAPFVTGTLRDSITVTDEGVEVMADYGVYVEYGHDGVDPDPFLRPAADTIGTKPAELLAVAILRGI